MPASAAMEDGPKQQRLEMIRAEIEPILESARDFCFEHYEEDMEAEAVDAIRTAAKALAYRKKYFDVMNDKVVYMPSCKRLILNRDLLEEAEKQYYEEEDEFPAEYSKAIRTVVFQKVETSNKSDHGKDEIDEEEFMEKLAMEWAEAL